MKPALHSEQTYGYNGSWNVNRGARQRQDRTYGGNMAAYSRRKREGRRVHVSDRPMANFKTQLCCSLVVLRSRLTVRKPLRFRPTPAQLHATTSPQPAEQQRSPLKATFSRPDALFAAGEIARHRWNTRVVSYPKNSAGCPI